MSRASRLLELLEVLRRRRSPVTAETLARELGVSIRTLYRDIATLQSQGADIQGEPGLGYVLKPGFTLPPLMLSSDEIEALVLGSRWVALRGDERLGTAASHAVAKIRAVLPAELRESVDAATTTVPDMSKVEPIKVDVSIVRDAIRREHKLRIAYEDLDGRASERTVWPMLLAFFDRVLVLAAYCELRKDYRAFRIDRVATVEPTLVRYPRKRSELLAEWRKARGVTAPAGN